MIDGGLFTRDFLHQGILETAVWQALTDAGVAAFKASATQMLATIAARNNPNEAETEKDLVYPLLAAMGWADIDVQPIASTKGRGDVPDALLFADAASKATAGALKPKERFRHGLAIVEAKRWQRPLDREDKSKSSDLGTPSSQMQRYLRIVEELSKGTLRWGILTNGRVWRLVSNSVLLQAEPFIEFDLGKLLQIDGCPTDLLDKRPDAFDSDAHWHDHTLRLFMLLFGRAAFLVGDGHETFHALALREGKNWEAKVAKSLANTVFKDVFPDLANAIAQADPKRPQTLDAEFLDEVRQGVLILLYRLLFVLYAEDRNLLPDENGAYAEYCLSKMRRDVAQRKAEGKTYPGGVTSLWGRLTTIFDAISKGNDDLGIPPYNGGLFDPATAPILARVALPDNMMAEIIFGLSHQTGDGEPKYINYRDLSVQQLGSVYEQLLEYQLGDEAGKVVVTLNPFGRKSSGSYYTPDELVKLIIEETLTPLVEDAKTAFEAREKAKATIAELQAVDPANAILNLRIVDPAMGSGHFLVSLVDWLTDRVREAMETSASEVEGYTSPLVERIAEIRHRIETEAEARKWPIVAAQLNNSQIIRRMVLKRCVYGVDLNPMAVELAKVSLWLHSFTVGAPLSFLDHHLICGNALFGERVRPVMDLGFGGNLLISQMVTKARRAASVMKGVEFATDADIAEAKNSAIQYSEVQELTGALRSFMDLVHGLRWVGGANKVEARAAKRLKAGDFGDPQGLFEGTVPMPKLSATQETLLQQNDGTCKFSPAEKKSIADAEERLAVPRIIEQTRSAITREKFFHWEVDFPGVWQDWESVNPKGGFDAVIGNPPWDRMKFQEVEWFADRRRDIAAATRASDRKRMVDELIAANDPLVEGYHAAIARAEGSASVARDCGSYPLLSGGDTNLYSLFVERAHALVRPEGLVGLLTPSGIASDLTAAPFFKRMATGGRLKALYDFENRRTRYGAEPFFPDVDSRFKFCAMISSPKRTFDEAKCGFFLQDVSEIADPERCFPLTTEDFARVNPNTGTAPIFRSRRDANLTAQIYANAQVLVDRSSGEEVKAWPVKYSTMFHMTNDSGLFRTRDELAEKEGAWPIGGNKWQSKAGEWVPLYEGKMVQAYDHRAASITINPENQHRPAQPEPATVAQKQMPDWLPEPQYWVSGADTNWKAITNWVLGFKEITAPTNERTFMAALFPTVGFGNKVPILVRETEQADEYVLCANFNAVVFDYATRQKVQGQTLNLFIVEQLPVIPPERFNTTRFGPKTAAEIIREAVLELTYTAHDMAPFARDMDYVDEAGAVKTPFIWDEARRLKLRAKLDAVFFHLYGVTSRDDIRYIYSTFPIVERHEMADYGTYRSRDLCLAYMNALEAGQPDAEIAL